MYILQRLPTCLVCMLAARGHYREEAKGRNKRRRREGTGNGKRDKRTKGGEGLRKRRVRGKRRGESVGGEKGTE